MLILYNRGKFCGVTRQSDVLLLQKSLSKNLISSAETMSSSEKKNFVLVKTKKKLLVMQETEQIQFVIA